MSVNSAALNAAPQITGAIRQAARSSGISFEYLLTTAQIESNLNPAAQASTSSAKGLYQFIEQTWLATMKTDGAANGYGRYADAISRSADGRYQVADPSEHAAIMRLRSDPTASAIMAGAFTRANAEQLRSSIGRSPSEGELYIAHFLGPAGAGKLIGAAMTQPSANAAAMFPQAAAANPSIFKDSAGRSRSVGDVYAKLSGRFEVARAMSFTPGQRTAALAVPVIPVTVAPIEAAQTAAKTVAMAPPASATQDPAGVTQALAQARKSLPPQPDTKPLFQSMFTDRVNTAVTRTVSSLWEPAKTGAQPEPGRTLDLFTDIRPDGRKLIRGGTG